MNRRESKRKSQAECAGLSEPGTGKSRPRRNWRRMTCPNPISKSVIDMALGELTKACSLGELIEKCLLAFDTDGNLRCSDYTVNMTLTVHSWVVPSVELAHRLLALYPSQLRIPGFDPQLGEGRGVRAIELEEGFQDLAHVWNRKLSYQGSPACGRKRKVSLLFDHLDAEQLAEHLSYLEFKAFCRLSTLLPTRSYVLRGSVRGSLALEHSVTLCNSISQWVQVMILNRPTAQQRAEVFAKFLHVTQKLHQLQNFNTLMAVVGGLCHSTISRLKETRALLPNEVTKALSEMTELLSSCGNYGTYRRVYSECRGFKIPIVGVHLKDLVTVHEALPDRLEGGRLKLSKLHSLYQPLQELRELQQATHPFQANKDLVHLLTLSLDLFFTDEEIYALSYAREPRYPKSLPSTPFKPPLVDWPPAVTPKRDRLTITRHIQQLVEVGTIPSWGKDTPDSIPRPPIPCNRAGQSQDETITGKLCLETARPLAPLWTAEGAHPLPASWSSTPSQMLWTLTS
uniref:RAS guanyl releasing protein 4 n=1 Tax=Sphenodon punctatus TaxID=8508 RepID=A0A8D0L3Q3_SPHPU